MVTTNLVIAESHALLLRRAGIRAGLAFVRLVRQPPNVIVESTAKIEGRAVSEWLTRFSDQPFSMVDAVSFVVMTDRSIADALTLDHHFAIAGFGMQPQGHECGDHGRRASGDTSSKTRVHYSLRS